MSPKWRGKVMAKAFLVTSETILASRASFPQFPLQTIIQAGVGVCVWGDVSWNAYHNKYHNHHIKELTVIHVIL